MQMLYFGKMPGMTKKSPRPPQSWRQLMLRAGAGRLSWWDGTLGPVNHLPSRDGRVASCYIAPQEKGTEVCVVHCAELFRGEATRAGGVRRTQVNPPPGAGPSQIYGVTSAGLSQAGNGLLADVFPLPHTPAKASW